MGQYSMFVTHQDAEGVWHKSGGLLLSAVTPEAASKEAADRADFLTVQGAAQVSILVMGDDPHGRPIDKILRS